MKIVIGVILFTLVHLKAYTQGDFIRWNKDVKIAWSDFKGKRDAKSPFAAMSAAGIQYKYNSISNGKVYKIRFTIYTGLDRTKSWSKSGAQTSAILKHEQLHFDIAELVSRAFKKEAEQTVYSKHYKNEISRIFNRYTDYLQKLQQKYDVQTMHSNNKVKQKDWEKLIHQELLR
jgi:hypothetical protein